MEILTLILWFNTGFTYPEVVAAMNTVGLNFGWMLSSISYIYNRLF